MCVHIQTYSIYTVFWEMDNSVQYHFFYIEGFIIIIKTTYITYKHTHIHKPFT